MMWKRRPLIAGAVTLFASGLLIRVISTVYRVLLVRVAGEDIVGLFQLTLPVYRLGWTLATFGIPVAISQLTADAAGRGDAYGASRLRSVGLKLTALVALVTAAGLAFGNELVAVEVLTDARTGLPLVLMGLLLFPAALCSAYRGVVQGQQRMTPIAASNALEVIVRAPVVLFAVAWTLPWGIEWGAASIVFGLIVGELASLALLFRIANKGDSSLRPAKRPRGRSHFLTTDFIPYAKRLLRIGIPVMGSGVLNNLLNIFSVAIIPRRLGLAGFTMEEAVRAYGRMSGMAIPLLYMPMVVISPIVSVLEPTVARRRAQAGSQAIGPVVRKAYAVAVGISILSAAAFFILPEQLGKLLYNVEGLAGLIRPLTVAAPFAYIGYVTSGVLYGLGRTGIVMINSAVGNIVRLVIIWNLAAQPQWGIEGVMWGAVADYAVSAVLHMVTLPRAVRRG